jgi:8-oxo-dGTP pyrophosphatase MutT (NUDIX family)
MTTTERPSSVAAAAADVIREAACIVVIDRDAGEPRVLMGRRLETQVFLPNKWVFPGGRVDQDDHAFAAAFTTDYTPANIAPALRPFALAAVRELFEETGYLVGHPRGPDLALPQSWHPFASSGHLPAPVHLTPLARAITPPGRVRRYDTWFFTAPRSAMAAGHGHADGELLDLDWFTLTAARKLDLPNITRLVLDDVATALDDCPDTAAGKLPFYYQDDRGFQRALIGCAEPHSPP